MVYLFLYSITYSKQRTNSKERGNRIRQQRGVVLDSACSSVYEFMYACVYVCMSMYVYLSMYEYLH